MNIDQFISQLESSDAYRNNGRVRKLVDDSRQVLIDLAHGDDGDAFKAELTKFNSRLDECLSPVSPSPVAPEIKKPLIEILKSRFESHPERHGVIEWAEVEKALYAKPDKMAALKKMEESGGEPDVIGFNAYLNSFMFVDCAYELPRGRKGLNFNEASAMAQEFGAELMERWQYLHLQDLGKFDLQKPEADDYGFRTWLETSAKDLKSGNAMVGVRRGDSVSTEWFNANNSGLKYGLRCALKVPKV